MKKNKIDLIALKLESFVTSDIRGGLTAQRNIYFLDDNTSGMMVEAAKPKIQISSAC